MTIVWRVLLGTASGLAMVAGTQAAELGDKAEPVQFVKICSLDGHSYYYIPGNDACTKNGLSLTIGADDRRSKSLMNLSGATAPRIGGQSIDHPGEVWPDPFISLRTDQAWGYGALVGGAHSVQAYTGRQLRAEQSRSCRIQCVPAGGRGRLRSRQRQARLLHGARRRGEGADFRRRRSHRRRRSNSARVAHPVSAAASALSTPDLSAAGNNLAAGWLPDGGSGIELTTAWSVQAGYDHQWSPSLNTSLFAGYSNITVDTDTTSFFAGAACGSAASGAAAQAGINCKSNWGNVGAGLRTSWAPASGLTLSVQTMYNYVWSGFTGTGNVFGGPPAARPANSYNFANQGVWSSYLRINRSFSTGD